MRVIFILRNLSKNEKDELLNNSLNKESILYFENERFIDLEFQKKTNVKSIYSQNISLDRFTDDLIQTINSFGHYNINGKSLATRLKTYSNSYWYYLRFSLYHRSRPFLTIKFLVQQLIEKNRNSNLEIKVYGTEKNIISDAHQDIEFVPGSDSSHSKKSLQTLFSKISYLLKYTGLFTYRAIIGSLVNSRKKLKTATQLIITNVYNQQSIIDLKTSQLIQGDPHLHYLLEKTSEDSSIQYLSQIKPPALDLNHSFNINVYLKKNKFSKKIILFESFLLASIFSARFYKDYKRIIKEWNSAMEILNNSKLNEIEKILFKCLKPLKRQIFLAAWRENAATKLGDYLNIKTVTAIDEHALQNQSIFNGLKRRGIKTIAIQHGAISNSNMAYKFSPSDLNHQPFPDLTLLRGSYTQQMLLNQNYPPNQLRVVGHIRTDAIPIIKSASFNFDLFDSNPKKPLILYATQPIPPQEQSLKKQLTADFFELCDEFPQYNFVLKPHPNEGSLALYESHARKLKHPNFKFYSGNLYFILAKADVVLTYFSTVGIEGIYFDKPLITNDYLKVDAQGYLKDGVSINATNYSELKDAIIQVIENGSTISKEKTDAFIEQRVFKIDGKVAERCYKIINDPKVYIN